LMEVDLTSEASPDNFNLAFELWTSNVNPVGATPWKKMVGEKGAWERKDPDVGSSKPTGEILLFFNWGATYQPTITTETKARNTIVRTNFVEQKQCGKGVTCQLWHTDSEWETWGPYRQWRIVDNNGVKGPLKSFKGIIDLKALLDGDSGFKPEYWLTRLELGNETFQNSNGKTTVRLLRYIVNGISRTAANQVP